MPALSKKQYKCVCDMLVSHGIPVNADNVIRYIKQNPRQLRKLAKNVIQNQRGYDAVHLSYLRDIFFKFELFGYTYVIYKRGTGRGMFDRIPIKDKNENK